MENWSCDLVSLLVRGVDEIGGQDRHLDKDQYRKVFKCTLILRGQLQKARLFENCPILVDWDNECLVGKRFETHFVKGTIDLLDAPMVLLSEEDLDSDLRVLDGAPFCEH